MSSDLSCCSTPPAGGAHLRQCPATTPGKRPGTKAACTRPIRPRSMRSSQSCAKPRLTGRLGVERSSRAMARCPGRAAGRCAVLRDRRADAWAAVVSDRRARRAAPLRGGGRRSAPLRAAPAPTCARGGARQGRGATAGHPTAARAFVRLDHERLPARDRRRGDHRHDPRATRADDARQRRPRTLRPAGQAGGSAAPRNRPPAPTQPLLGIAAARPSSPAWLELLRCDRVDRAAGPHQHRQSGRRRRHCRSCACCAGDRG